jgi:molybdopterin-guanine dinucleotide biosynthesis protein A
VSAGAIVLAGGMSTRLGRDKAGEVLLGRTLLQRVIDSVAGSADEIVVVCRAGQELPALDSMATISRVEDLYPDAGPLGGLYSGLLALEARCALAVACDMPLLQPALLGELVRLGRDHDIVAPVQDGLPQPLCAAYSKACIEPIRRCLEAGIYKLTAFFAALQPYFLMPEQWRCFDPEGLSFQNLNTPADRVRIEALLSR